MPFYSYVDFKVGTCRLPAMCLTERRPEAKHVKHTRKRQTTLYNSKKNVYTIDIVASNARVPNICI